MSFDLLLKPSCSGCGSTTDLYGSNCKHMTLCLSCGKTMAENRGKCFDCGATVTRLIREYNVRASTSSDKNYFIGRFVSGLPSFSKKKNAENKWSLHKEGIIGRQITDALREKFKNKPWLLEDETGQSQYQGHLEGSQSATYYLLMMTGKEFVAIPAGSWYNFNKVAHYKQLTLEEAEEKMKNRRKTADGYERWMMKAANNGAAAFGEVEKVDDKEGVSAGGRGGRRKASGDDDEEEVILIWMMMILRRVMIGSMKKFSLMMMKLLPLILRNGRIWLPEAPAPPEIKQDEDDEDEENEEGGLSKSGKELKKLLGKANGLDDESDVEDDDDDEDMDGDISPVLAPKQKDAELKEEPADNSPAKPTPSSSAKGTPPTSKSTKGKRKLNGEDAKSSNGAPVKKVKTENEVKPTVKEESSPATKGTATPKVTTPSSKTGSTSGSTGPVSEEEIRAVLLQNGPVTTQDLVARFKSRLRTPEDKKAFADILRRISKIQKTSGSNYVVLRDK
ncbi:hypothetical protein OIU85_000137 [Salix viminalis]|uniref:Transcription initiation factor IIF subunit alpha n=1 Tax=Salix viminalis TaxID=40686 RepID=A0A9Q0VIU6_SALVM|nr:hypothetical protein OIU85_000137 [Salix viminalis]